MSGVGVQVSGSGSVRIWSLESSLPKLWNAQVEFAVKMCVWIALS